MDVMILTLVAQLCSSLQADEFCTVTPCSIEKTTPAGTLKVDRCHIVYEGEGLVKQGVVFYKETQ